MVVTDGRDANLRLLELVSVWAAPSLGSNGIDTGCHQNNPLNDVKHITHMQSVLAVKIMEVYTKKEKKRYFKNNMASLSSKIETVVLRMI